MRRQLNCGTWSGRQIRVAEFGAGKLRLAVANFEMSSWRQSSPWQETKLPGGMSRRGENGERKLGCVEPRAATLIFAGLPSHLQLTRSIHLEEVRINLQLSEYSHSI
ncbi:hypothetical protein GQ55_5G099200 [Panicum hallii var. hallii]|uniref:Uncharacterized protein n=1 Tax=Panicum hallii var. hallii TaxID=1504633 RepID=A0A2T7DEN7_9POAL|nr:hypothetical protein GQ55_5G099200 [Panicum hallii var. hallii]